MSDGRDYNPEVSMIAALDKVQELLGGFSDKVTVAQAACQLQGAQLWTAIAQVHATNMQTEALRAAFPPPCANG